MSKPKLFLPDGTTPMPDQKINTLRAAMMPTQREQVAALVATVSKMFPAVRTLDHIVGVLMEGFELLVVHIDKLEKKVGIPDGEQLIAVLEKQRAEKQAKANAPEKVQQPPPQGRDLTDPPQIALDSQQAIDDLIMAARNYGETLKEEVEILGENSVTGDRKWFPLTMFGLADVQAGWLPLKIGPKPPTQGVGFDGAPLAKVLADSDDGTKPA